MKLRGLHHTTYVPCGLCGQWCKPRRITRRTRLCRTCADTLPLTTATSGRHLTIGGPR